MATTGNPCTIVRNDQFVGKIKGPVWTVRGNRDLMCSCVCAYTDRLCTRKPRCQLLLCCYMNRSGWGVSFFSKRAENKTKAGTDKNKGWSKRKERPGEIWVIQEGAGIFHHYTRESWLWHKGTQPTWKIKRIESFLIPAPTGQFFFSSTGHIFVLCLSFSFYETKITSFTFFRLGL